MLNMKKIIINRGELSFKEALFLTFWLMSEIEKETSDMVVSTKWFWSAMVKYNKESITVSVFPPLHNDTDRQKYLWKLLNNFLVWLDTMNTKNEFFWFCKVYWVEHECWFVNNEWWEYQYCPECGKLTKYE